jgi:hypothetical protein
MLSVRQPCSISSLTYYLLVCFVFFFSFQHALFGRADFVDHDLPLRSAVARAIYQTAELSDRPRVRLNHTHNEHP